jgi:(S)-2-hydroxyglutarate dehydrogenase
MDHAGELDVVVVGAGILGLATARELLLRHPGIRLAVLEKETAPAMHQTARNSGVVHAGIYYAPGSLKARLCVEGARDLYAYCERKGVQFERCGKLVVAVDESEIEGLDELERRGRANGVPGLRRLGGKEIEQIEPHARGVAALHSPETGIVDFRAMAAAIANEVEAAGGRILTGCEVRRATEGGGALRLLHGQGETSARFAVFCAGQWADRLAEAAGAPRDPRIVPFRGAYLRLRPERRHLVRSLIYPVPDPRLPFLGVHLTRHVDGEVLVGPTALAAGARDAYSAWRVRPRDLAATLAWPGTWRMALRFWRTGVRELRHAASRRTLVAEAARYVPGLEVRDVLPGFAGIRAQALGRDGTLVDDFVVSATPRALHLRNAPSPAATASLAIARLIADRAEQAPDSPL